MRLETANSLSLSSYAKPRQSGIELLRLVAMMMVLVLHANWQAFGPTTTADVADHPWRSVGSLSLEFLSIIAVNTFVLISGYFGIRLRVRGLLNILFQSAFYTGLIYVVLLLLGALPVSPLKGLGYVFLPLSRPGGWFLPVYFTLMVLSPALNALARSVGKLSHYIVLFYLTLILWGNQLSLNSGYSVISFVGLYLLGRWMSQRTFSVRGITLFGGYLLVVALELLAALYLIYFQPERWDGGWNGRMIAYSSPAVILASVLFFLTFTKLHFSSRWINWAASSTLAIYLIHCHEWVFPSFKEGVRALWGESLALSLLQIVGYLVAIFVGSILVDKVRLLVWQRLVLPLYDRLVRGWLRRGWPLPKLPS